jgi:hypothetical protein
VRQRSISPRMRESNDCSGVAYHRKISPLICPVPWSKVDESKKERSEEDGNHESNTGGLTWEGILRVFMLLGQTLSREKTVVYARVRVPRYA